MLGTLKFSLRIQYGRNKRNIPYYLFHPINNSNINKKIIVASKFGKTTKIDHYAKINILKENDKQIIGCLEIIIGPINDYNVTKKIILLKNNIFNNKIKYNLDNSEIELKNKLNFTYSIDPKGSKDIDDAFSYDFINDILYIHITDLSDLEIPNLDDLLNKSFTFYDDDFNINMLPEEISENEKSLLEGKVRKTITMEIKIKTNEFKFTRSSILVNKNLSYEESDILFNKDDKWIQLKNNLTSYLGNFQDSHQFIEKLMILYNSKFHTFIKKDFPIRTHKGIKQHILTKLKNNNIIDDNLIKKICYHGAEYSNINSINDTNHIALNLDKYTHSTSPLRRVIDLINQKIAFNNFDYNIDILCNRVNERHKEVKNAYREIKLLNLISNLQDINYEAIIISFNKNLIQVYIPKLDIIQSIKILHDKIINLFSLNQFDEYIEIIHTETNSKIILRVYQKINLNTMILNYESQLFKRLQFYITNPNLLEVIN